jgi:hypothetical protein
LELSCHAGFPTATFSRPAFEMCISHLIRNSRSSASDHDFLDRDLMLTRELLNQGFLVAKLKSSLRKFYDLHHDLVYRYGTFMLKAVNRKIDNTIAKRKKRTKGQTTIYKTLHRKTKIGKKTHL